MTANHLSLQDVTDQAVREELEEKKRELQSMYIEDLGYDANKAEREADQVVQIMAFHFCQNKLE